MIALTIDAEARTVEGTSKGDDLSYRSFGLLWSRGRGCWVWARTTTPERISQAIWQLQRLAERREDLTVEVVGEAVAVTIDQDERNEAIAERHERQGAAARAEADARYSAARQTADMIPMGQPILVGHHSEGRHRRDIARIDSDMRRSVEADRAATEHERLAEVARGRIDARETWADAERCPRELMAPGDTVTKLYRDGRRRKFPIVRVNAKTVSWEHLGCSGKIDLDRIIGCERPGVGIVWPIPRCGPNGCGHCIPDAPEGAAPPLSLGDQFAAWRERAEEWHAAADLTIEPTEMICDDGVTEILGDALVIVARGEIMFGNLRRLHEYIEGDDEPSAADQCEVLYRILGSIGLEVS